jgi:Pectate lyase superfamily protein/IPT/TIG domain
MADPTISSVTPTVGPTGTAVTVSGTGLSAVTGATVGGIAVTPTIVSDTELRFTVPTGTPVGADDIVLAFTASSAGPAFTVTGSGSGLIAVPRSLTPPPPPPADAFNVVTAYGADPTGRVDSGLAIRTAMAAAQAQASGGSRTVYFPSGVYLVTSSDPAVGPAFYLPVLHAAIRLLGAGRDVTRVVGNNRLGAHLCTLQVDGCVVDGLTFDTALYAAGTALSVAKVNRCSWLRMGACTGPDVGLLWTGPSTTVHAVGNLADDIYLDDGAQLIHAGWGTSYQDSYSVTNVIHVGGHIGHYYSGDPTNPASACVVDGYQYTPSLRADNRTGLNCARISYHTFSNINGPAGQRTIRMFSEFGTGSTAAEVGTNVTWDTVNGGVEVELGDINNLLIKNSTLGPITIDPVFSCQGAFVATTHGAVSYQQQPGAVVSLPGI